MATLNELWLRLIEIHQHTKELILKSEESGPEKIEFRAFLQPLKEQRDVLEHIIRAQAALHLSAEPSKPEGDFSAEEIAIKNLDKAVSHAYRAFFDQADFMSITLRKKLVVFFLLIPIRRLTT